MVHALIPAAGSGVRFGEAVKKQFLPLCGLPVIVHTLSVFEGSCAVDDLICVAPQEDLPLFEKMILTAGFTKIRMVLSGGTTRQNSVGIGVAFLEKEGDPEDVVLVHDGVRPFVTPLLIEAVVRKAKESGAAVAAMPVTDSVKRLSCDNVILEGISRDSLWAMQTPQAFRLEILIRAFQKAAFDRFSGTDEASLVERLGVPVHCVEGLAENIKITTPSDLKLAEWILRERRRLS